MQLVADRFDQSDFIHVWCTVKWESERSWEAETKICVAVYKTEGGTWDSEWKSEILVRVEKVSENVCATIFQRAQRLWGGGGGALSQEGKRGVKYKILLF